MYKSGVNKHNRITFMIKIDSSLNWKSFNVNELSVDIQTKISMIFQITIDK